MPGKAARARHKEKRLKKFHVVAPGVGVRHEVVDGKRVAVGVILGGFRDQADLVALRAHAQKALASWPERITKLEVVVEDRPEPAVEPPQ